MVRRNIICTTFGIRDFGFLTPKLKSFIHFILLLYPQIHTHVRHHKWIQAHSMSMHSISILGTSHSATRMAVSHGVHRVMHDSPIVPFAIFLYGYARADSYGYPGGLRLADLTLECVPGKPGDGLDNDCDRRIDEEIKNYIDDDNDGKSCLPQSNLTFNKSEILTRGVVHELKP